MNQDQYGSIMRELGILIAKVEGLEREEGHIRRAIGELETQYDNHLLNDHGHPPYSNSRRRPVEVALIGARWGGGGLLVYAILEGLTRFFLGG